MSRKQNLHWPLLCRVGLVFIAMTTSVFAAEVKYSLSFEATGQHYLDVRAEFIADKNTDLRQQQFFIPTWIPGSYLQREYAQHIVSINAYDNTGKALKLNKLTKNRWQLDATNAAISTFSLKYRLYCLEKSVRGNWLCTDFALVNGAATFIAPVNYQNWSYSVSVKLAKNWKSAVCALQSKPGDFSWQTRSFDSLADSPIACGNPVISSFQVRGKPHYLAHFGDSSLWNTEKAARDVERIVAAQAEFWGSLPYERYVFFNFIVEAGGGLEHSASTVLMTSRWLYRRKADYKRWLGLVSHEFFHTWNVKRLRPKVLRPFNYEQENYTRDLWIVEGITNYYTDLMLYRAGLMTKYEYLYSLANAITVHENLPGRQVQSLEESSFDAWIKYYRRNANSKNVTISYYRKGSLAGFLLNAKLQELSEGKVTLDDLMREAYKRYSGESGYTSEQFEDLATELANQPLGEFFDHVIRSTKKLPYEKALSFYGKKFVTTRSRSSWLGWGLENRDGRVFIKAINHDSPAYHAALNVDDEVIAVNNYRVLPDRWTRLKAQFRVGEKLTILVSRRGKLRSVEAVLKVSPHVTYSVSANPDLSDALKATTAARESRWLTGKAEAPQKSKGKPRKARKQLR